MSGITNVDISRLDPDQRAHVAVASIHFDQMMADAEREQPDNYAIMLMIPGYVDQLRNMFCIGFVLGWDRTTPDEWEPTP